MVVLMFITILRFTLFHLLISTMICSASALKLRLVCFLGFAFLSCQSSEGTVAESTPNNVLVPLESQERWGYADIHGEIVIEPTYTSALPFVDSLALVTTEQSAFLINRLNEVRSPSYASLVQGSGGYIATTTSNKFDVLRMDGSIISEQLDTAFFVDHDIVEYRKGVSRGLMNMQGTTIIDGEYDQLRYLGYNVAAGRTPNGWFAVHNNTRVNSAGWEFVGPYQHGFSGFNVDGHVGLLDSTAKIVVEAKYDEVRFFNGGVAVVGIAGKYGAINEKGELIIPLKYDELGDNSYDALAYKLDDAFGYVRTNGEPLFDKTFAAGSPFYGSNAIVFNEERMAALVDNTGTPVCDFEYHNIVMMDLGLFRVQKDLQFWLMDSLGTLLTDEPMSKLVPFNLEEVALCERNEKWNALRKDGSFVFDTWYERVKSASDGYFLVENNTKWGVLNADLVQTVPNVYAAIGAFRDGYTWCRANNKFGILHRDKGEVLAPKYDELGSFIDGYAYFMSGDRMGVIDTAGTIVIPAQYDYAGPLEHTQLFSVTNGNKRGVLSKKGKVIVPAKMDRITVLHSGIIKCELGNRTIYYSQDGRVFSDRPIGIN